MGMWRALKALVGISPPFPKAFRQRPLRELQWLALDMELTGLDKKVAEVTSIGWVVGGHGDIPLSECFYQVVNTAGNLAQSPVIHGLTHEQLALGLPIDVALERLAPYASTHVWVLHNASLDLGVLDRLLRERKLRWPPVVAVDTLKLAVYQLKKHHDLLPPNSATLTVCRQRLGLGVTLAHNALDDALATLQLWYAQQGELGVNAMHGLEALKHTGAVAVISLGIDKALD